MAPLEPLFSGAVALRGALFDGGWLAAHEAPVPVVSVGNLTVGGSGKSPMTAWITGRLARAGRRPAVISRGYGGAHRGPATVVSAGEGPLVDASIAGDEPVMLAARLTGVPVIVSRRRLDGARLAAERFDARCVVLDDGFQHRALARNLDLVMLDALDPFGTGRLLPSGILREPVAALRRASALVLHGAADEPGAEGLRKAREAASRHCPRAPLLRSRLHAEAVLEAATGAVSAVETLRGMTVVCVAGIAHPGRFFEMVRACGARVAAAFPFADHHRLTAAELDDVARGARDHAADAVLTTEKDLARLGAEGARRLPGLRGLRMEMIVQEDDLLERLILEATA